MDTNALRTFATRTRKDLIGQVARRLSVVLPADSDARREAPAAMAELDREIARSGEEAVIDQVAYTWFNRFTALRYMDVCEYLIPKVVSPGEGETRPEILSQAAQGVLPDHVRKDVASQVHDLLEGRVPSREPQVEAYRRLVVASCNALHGLMPFLFERIEDYSELLMPNELLADTGWVAELRAVMTAEACKDVEIIGWLYQFYIAEKKQDVFDALKKNVKITAANIPAATQLFTPHWIVRYLVENSLGRLWLLNHPESDLADKMVYYIAPEEPETDFLRVNSPEEIRICDPACGSGHMLTYAFDLLSEIYLERGYAARDIPGLILTHNLTGIEIDGRAGGLAAFALMMKAAGQLGRRRFLQMEARPDIIVLENVSFRLSDFNNLLIGLGYDMNVDQLGGGLKTVPLALLGIWSQVSAYLKLAEGPGFEESFEGTAAAFVSGLADEIGLFDEAVKNPFIISQFNELRLVLLAIADADTKQRNRIALERGFRKRTCSLFIAERVSRIGSDYRIHKNSTTYRMELDALMDRIEEAVRYPDALSKLKGIEGRLIEALIFHAPLWATVRRFEHAKNFGSLIVPKVANANEVLERFRTADLGGDLMLSGTRDRVVAVLRMAKALAPRYHVVVANPPYMDVSGGNAVLKNWASRYYPISSLNLYSMFMERGLNLCYSGGMLAMINMQAWMFLKSFENLRENLISQHALLSMLHIGENGFDSILGDVVSTTAFVVQAKSPKNKIAEFIRLTSGQSEASKITLFNSALQEKTPGLFFRIDCNSFREITGSPLAYWTSVELRNVFKNQPPLKEFASPRKGMVTADNPRFIRFWHEMQNSRIGWNFKDREEAKLSRQKWFPYLKGGSFRRWYGNNECVVNWENDGTELLNMKGNGYKVGSTNHNLEFIFKPAISWTKITSGLVSFRSTGYGYLFDDASGLCPVKNTQQQPDFVALLNSPVVYSAIGALNPTLNLYSGTLADLPVIVPPKVGQNAESCIELSRSDWNAFETSWDFTTLPLLSLDHRSGMLEAAYARLRAHWRSMTEEMRRLEEENNGIFIDAYGLQDELTPEVQLNEITLTCNPAYSIKGNMSDETREARMRERTMKEFISYAIGCMFGRYSLDAPGLILANQGDTLQDYLARVPDPTFLPDSDNIIPVLGNDRFENDAYIQFRTFLSRTFGADQLDENLAFIRETLGRDVQDYLIKRFFDDHSDRYSKCPIYWMISSPKGAFQALIYMHRYGPDTLSTVLTRYVRPLRDRLEEAVRAAEAEQISSTASAAQRNKAQKEIDQLNRQITELTNWERDHLYPMALQRRSIDLDDGVKRNYPLFNGIMKPVKGLSDA